MSSNVSRLILLLLIGLFLLIAYQRSTTYRWIQKMLDDNQVNWAKAVSSNNIKNVVNGEIPVFGDNTLFPAPGGGYCSMTPIKDPKVYFRALDKATAHCKELQKFNLYRVCLDGLKNKKNNCVALSFGINFDFSFEDLVIDRLGCQAYSFDPTMGTSDYTRKNGKDKFFDLGLSSFKGAKTISYEKGERTSFQAKVDRYVNIVNMLGLADKEIDILKIDIEGSELDFFLDTASSHPELFKNIRQIQLEFHTIENDKIWHNNHSGNRNDTTVFDMMKIVDILHCHGFGLLFNTGRNPKFQYRSVSGHTTWIRT